MYKSQEEFEAGMDPDALKIYSSLCKVYGKLSVLLGCLSRTQGPPVHETEGPDFDVYGVSKTFPWKEYFGEIEKDFQLASKTMEEVDSSKL